MAMAPVRLVLTGGGSAGHVLPHVALVEDPKAALARAIAEDRVRVTYMGSHSGIERDVIGSSRPEWDYVAISTGKFRRYLSLQNVIDPVFVLRGVVESYRHLKRLKAGAVFSKGGFVAAPVVWAAALRRIPIVIHESDFSPALATRLTAPWAGQVLVAFEDTLTFLSPAVRRKARVIGVPIRPSLFAADRDAALTWLGFDDSRPVVLVYGGSLGALSLNRALEKALPMLGSKFQIIHVAGKGKRIDVPDNAVYRQFEFLGADMAQAYAAADIALCRAGASSLFELAAARIPMILVPLGLDQSRGDQVENARRFAERGWATVLDDAALSAETIVEALERVERERAMWCERLSSAPGPDAAGQVGSLLLEVLGISLSGQERNSS